MLISLLEFALVTVFSLGLIGYTMLQGMTSSKPPGMWPGILICVYAALPFIYLSIRLALLRRARKQLAKRTQPQEAHGQDDARTRPGRHE